MPSPTHHHLVQPEYWSLCDAVREDFPDTFPQNCKATLDVCRRRGIHVVWVRADYRPDRSPWFVPSPPPRTAAVALLGARTRVVERALITISHHPSYLLPGSRSSRGSTPARTGVSRPHANPRRPMATRSTGSRSRRRTRASPCSPSPHGPRPPPPRSCRTCVNLG